MKRKVIFIINIFIMICLICFIKITNSRYVSNVNADGNIDVAIPQIVMETSNVSNIVRLLPGEKWSTEFSIKNYKDSNINEILMNYYLDVNTINSNIPLIYKIYKISGSNQNELTKDTQGFGPLTLNYGTKEEQQYKIEVEWDESNNNISYENKEFSFQLLAKTKEIYEQNIISEAITLKGREYLGLTTNISVVPDVENAFDIEVTNPNSYEVKYKIIEENDMYNVEYEGTSEAFKTISANTTETIRVIFSGKKDVVYEDLIKDSYGNLYKTITIVLDAINPYDASNIQIATNQIIYLQKSIKNNIILAAGRIEAYEEGFVFSGISAPNEAALCSIIDPVSGETIYFYRGNITNNYVYFAGHTWRILRINSDGSLRLILNDIATTSRYQTSNTPTENNIQKAIELLNWRNSTVYSTLHTWYNTNIANYADKVVESQFVFDTSYDESTSSLAGACYYFGPYLRVGVDGNLFAPTFSYTEDSLITDTIGLITADEVLYAGGYFKTNNTSYFLYNSAITRDWWTMSPSFWDNAYHYKAGMFVLSSSGNMHDWPENGNTLLATLGLRPVISIRGDLEMEGTGTISDPYEYKE